MSYKLYSDAVILDGKLDEAVWASAAENTGFVRIATAGGGLADVQTSFKVYSADECVYFGVKCYEPDMASVIAGHPFHDLWGCDAIELFLSPSGKSFDFYQFVVTFGGKQVANYHSEGGNIKPDPYRPFWKCAVHADEDFWSLEAAIPLTAFYMTEPDDWSSEWLVNVTRTRTAVPSKMFRSTWSKLDTSYLEPNNFRKLGGFPMRKPEDAVRIVSADVELTSAVGDGYTGVMSVKTLNPVAEKFVFATKYTEPYETQLKVGYNDFTLPCRFDETGRISVAMSLCRESDGKMFERYYPIKVNYEPLKVRMVLPEYRSNFYPGQDYSRVEGYVEVGAGKEAVVTLTGPGIGTLTAVPESDGHFVFDTSGLEIGTAVLTASIPEYKVEKKIRRLDKTGHRMAWISGGNLIVDGEPVLRRNMYAEYYRGGEAFKRRYDADDDYCMTMEITSNPLGSVEPSRLIKGIENIEAQKDVVPCDELLKLVEETIERNRDRDFVYYYINDEPECRGLSPIYLKHLYDFIAEKDPYHVVLMASRGASKFIDCADWFETHPYINPCTHADGSRTYSRNINTLGSFIDDVIKLGRSDKCIGLIPTCFSYKFTSRTEFGPDYPNFREMVCHIWAAMIRGGKTIWPYAYHDLNDRASLYEGTRYIFKSFAALDKLVLLGKRTTLV
nr:hypothetical protein [Clostridia bacterium]